MYFEAPSVIYFGEYPCELANNVYSSIIVGSNLDSVS